MDRFSRLQLELFVIMADMGEQAMRRERTTGRRWNGEIPWQPIKWFGKDYQRTGVSRALRRMCERGYVERIRPGEGKFITKAVRLTAAGFAVAKEAKYGRIQPMPEQHHSR